MKPRPVERLMLRILRMLLVVVAGRPDSLALIQDIDSMLSNAPVSEQEIAGQAAQIIMDIIPGGASQRDVAEVITAAIRQAREIQP